MLAFEVGTSESNLPHILSITPICFSTRQGPGLRRQLDRSATLSWPLRGTPICCWPWYFFA